jgi:acetyltransferase-like isoleucine patch superfamily enzyme
VNLALRMLSKTLSFPARLTSHLNLQRKREACLIGEFTHLYPASRVDNYQPDRQAIAVGNHCHILGQLLVLAHGGTIQIGDFCFIGEGSRLWSATSIKIGNRVLVSHGVNIHDHDAHSLSAHSRHMHALQILNHGHPSSLEDVASKPVNIEDDAWIGFNSTILKGVTIGRGAIVAAATVITKDVPEFAIVAGNPARLIGRASL